MELKAQYDLDDLMDLVEQDLEAKGFRLVGGLSPSISCQDAAVIFTLAIEQLTTQTIAPALPAPAPAATVTRAAKPQPANKKVKTPEQIEKERAYKREWLAKKRAAEKTATQTNEVEVLPEVVAPSTVPFQFQPSHSLNR